MVDRYPNTAPRSFRENRAGHNPCDRIGLFDLHFTGTSLTSDQPDQPPQSTLVTPVTSLRITTIVVGTIAVNATVGVCALSYCLIAEKNLDATLVTAYVGLTAGLVGALTGLLINTRTIHHATPIDTKTETLTPPK